MPFQVCYVSEDDVPHPILEDVCRQLKIKYTQRVYDSWSYSADRDYITRLPAFHVFENNLRVGTYYPHKDIDKLEHLLEDYNIRQQKRKRYSWKRILLGGLLKTDSPVPNRTMSDTNSR